MKKHLNLLIFLGLVLGIIGGFFIPQVMTKISFIGEVYINLLKLIILPIIFTTVTISVYKNLINKDSVILKALVFFGIVFIIVFLFTSLFFHISKLGQNAVIDNVEAQEVKEFSTATFMLNLFPKNLVQVITDNNILFTIIFASVFAFASLKIEKSHNVINLIDTISDILNKILEYIMYLTPLAVFALIGKIIAEKGLNVLEYTMKYIFLVYGISFIILILLVLIVFRKINIITYIKKMLKIWLVTISTCSSLATLPYALKVVKEEMNLDKERVDLVLPLGVALNKIGGAIAFAALAIFTTQVYGINIGIGQYILMLFLAIIINTATAGIPGGGIVIGTTYLAALGLPLGFIGIYAGIYRFLDMAYTTVNMTANISITAVIAGKNERVLNKIK